MSPGPELDAARARIAGQGLTVQAVGQFTEVVSALPLVALGRVTQLLKRCFSDRSWTGG